MIDRYLDRRYHPKTYNCAHFVCDVWQDLKGIELAELMKGFLCGRSERKGNYPLLKKHIAFIDKPETVCVVLMQSPRVPPHVGIWLNGKVLQLTRRGVNYLPLEAATIGYKKIRYFTCNM